MTPELALAIGLGAGYLAFVLFFLWPTGHLCHDTTCRRDDSDELKK